MRHALLALFVAGCTGSTEAEVTRLPAWESPAEPTCPDRMLASEEALVRAPYLNSVRPDSLVVAFGAPQAATAATVTYTNAAGSAQTLDAAREEVPGDGSTIALFHADVGELEAGTRYCYEVAIDGTVVASGLHFATSVPKDFDTTVRFIAIGDFGAGTPEQLDVRDAMLGYVDRADLFLTLGDNAYGSGTYDEWQRNVFAPNREVLPEVAYWPTWGNHDYSTDDAEPALANHFLPDTLKPEHHERYWALDHGPLHVVGLDSEGALLDASEGNQIEWAEADLAANTAPWTLALWHKPAFTGHESRTGDFFVNAKLKPLAQDNGVDVVLTGHDHFYERFHPVLDGELVDREDGGIPWIISGGGGRGLYPLEGHENEAYGAERHHFLWGEIDQCTLRIQAIGTDGEPFDTLELERC
ncbi:MAG: metallophosphoesterase [Proteobacteria bacterium]|nr:metallophosphoesterase [Pseudomonadota bacterium]